MTNDNKRWMLYAVAIPEESSSKFKHRVNDYFTAYDIDPVEWETFFLEKNMIDDPMSYAKTIAGAFSKRFFKKSEAV